MLTTGLGALALLVGGAGILGLMLMSVKERTSEIGLRMAVGATPRDILAQFLVESVLDDPSLNQPERLKELLRTWQAGKGKVQ